jgi:hypothetical protein
VAARKPNIAVGIISDTREFERSMDRAAKKTSTFKANLGANLVSAGVLKGLDLLADGIGMAFDFAQGGLEAFDSLGDSIALIDSNFAGLSRSIEGLDLTKLGFDKMETAASAEAISSAAKALGLTAEEAGKITPALTEASAAYSALSGKDAKEAGDLFAKALGGSAKAAKELGVEFTKGMTPAQRMEAIMAKWGPLAEDAATGTRSLADEQATFDAQMANIQVTLGGFLNQALTPLLAAFNEQFMPMLSRFATEVGPSVQAVVAVLGDVFGKVFGFIQETVLPIVAQLAQAIGKALGPVFGKVGGVVDAWMPVFEDVFGFLGATVVPLLTDLLIPAVGVLLEVLAEVSKLVAGALKAAFNALKGPLEAVGKAIRSVIDFVTDLINKIRTAPIISDFLDFIGGGSGGRSASFAIAGTGGIAPLGAGTPGTLTTRAAGGIVINFNGVVGDPVATGREVSRVLSTYRSRGGMVAR